MSLSQGTELKSPAEGTPSPGDATLTKNEDGSVESNGKEYYMSGPKLGLLIAGLCLALFLLGLDTSIVSTVSKCSPSLIHWSGLTSLTGNPKDHQDFQLDNRHWLVWKCLLSVAVSGQSIPNIANV